MGAVWGGALSLPALMVGESPPFWQKQHAVQFWAAFYDIIRTFKGRGGFLPLTMEEKWVDFAE